MAITAANLRSNFPEFTDVNSYPDAQINFWLGWAYQSLDSNRWKNSLDMGAQLMTCHQLVIERRAQLEAQNGGIPGTSTGAISSKSVDKVSVSFDTGGSAEEGAGHWNLTVYGTRFYRLCMMMGAGPLQIGAPDTSSLPPFSSLLAWGSPWFVNPNPSG